MRPRSKSMSDVRADSIQTHHTLHSNNNKHEHTQISAQLSLPVEVSDTDKVLTSEDMTLKHVMPMDVTTDAARWLRRQLRTLRTHIPSLFRYPLLGDKFVRRIIIEVQVNGNFVRRNARALFDTGCPINLMSRTMASTIGVVYPALMGEPILNTLGVDKFRSLGRIEGRWAPRNRHFNPKHYDAEWEISDKPEWYDVIIGCKTIIENKLIKLSPELG
jgi:hypothetical protein